MKRLVVLLSVLLLLGITIHPNSAQEPKPLSYLSPRPDAQHISPTTSIAVRQGQPLAPSTASEQLFTVIGSQSGRHSGSVRLSTDSRTLLFYPDQPFAHDEQVTVILGAGLATAAGEPVAGARWHFSTIDRPFSELPRPRVTEFEPRHDQPVRSSASATSSPYKTHPEFTNVMPISVTTAANGTAPGYLFFGIFPVGGYDSALIMADNTGEPIFIRRSPGGREVVSDFKRQIVNGVPYLTYHAGTLAPTGSWTNGRAVVLDQNYNFVDSWTIGNGYGADVHEFLLLENGNAILLSYTTIPYNLSEWDGPADGSVVDMIIQEQDPDKNVIFEWHATQWLPIGDTYLDIANTTPPVDYAHANAIEVDHDGNLLVSHRNLLEITKIDRSSGVPIWRLGGKSNQFTFTNDDGFMFQHDIRRQPNGNITLFDNGGQYPEPEYNRPHSRAVEYAIDENAKTITRVWQYPPAPDENIFGPITGSAQRMENGNTLISWGNKPMVTEIKPNGQPALELSLNGGHTYRTFRYEWDGLPELAPRLVAETPSDPTIQPLYFSWNGATDIVDYEVYAGQTPDAMTLVTTVPRSGFETSLTLTGVGDSTCVFQVRPVHRSGDPMPFSNYVYRPDRPDCLFLTERHLMPVISR